MVAVDFEKATSTAFGSCRSCCVVLDPERRRKQSCVDGNFFQEKSRAKRACEYDHVVLEKEPAGHTRIGLIFSRKEGDSTPMEKSVSLFSPTARNVSV